MATPSEIDAAVNGITDCLNLLGDVDWNAYSVEGPGLNQAATICRGLIAQAGMAITVASAIVEPIQVFVAAIEEASADVS